MTSVSSKIQNNVKENVVRHRNASPKNQKKQQKKGNQSNSKQVEQSGTPSLKDLGVSSSTTIIDSQDQDITTSECCHGHDHAHAHAAATNANESSTPLNINRIKQFFVGKHHDAPAFIADNQYILSGYRINFHRPSHALRSLFMVHNELVNIWTHVLGALLVLVLIVYVATTQFNLDAAYQVRDTWAAEISARIQPLVLELRDFDASLNSHVNKGIEWFKQKEGESLGELHRDLKEQLDNLASGEKTQMVVDKLVSFRGLVQEYAHQIEKTIKNAGSTPKEYTVNKLVEWRDKIDSHSFDWIDVLEQKYQSEEQNNGEDHVASVQSVSRWPIFVFLISAVLCLSFSAAFHLYYCLSPKVYSVMLRLDYGGVSLLISGSIVPLLYYGFYCQPTLAAIYIGAVSTACLGVFIVSLHDFIHTQPYFIIKSVMYGSLGIFAGFPIIHLVVHEISATYANAYSTGPSLVYYMLMGACYLIGLTLYALRCPERHYPGKFDICGASHQIWHLAILAAILLTYIGTLINYHTRKISVCPV